MSKIDIINPSDVKFGEQGVAIVKEWCETNKLLFKEASKKEDYHDGIDCFINEIPTDVKATEKLYFLQLYDNKINVRKPFHSKTKSTHIAKVNVDKKTVEHLHFHDYLEFDFFKTKEEKDKFLKILHSMENKLWSEYHKPVVSPKQFLFVIKTELQELVIEGVSIYYEENDKYNETSMYLVKKKPSTRKYAEKTPEGTLEKPTGKIFIIV